jgi:hypothetical protein
LINQQDTFGLLISIDNQTTTPLIDSNMMRLKSGTCTYINLRKTYSKDVPTPYSDCTSLDIFNSIYNSQFVNNKLSVSLHGNQKKIRQMFNCGDTFFNLNLSFLVHSEHLFTILQEQSHNRKMWMLLAPISSCF